MKAILKLAVLFLIPCATFAAFPTNSCVSTSRVDLIRGGFDGFKWDWNGYEDQNCRLCIMDSASTYVTLTGYYGAFKVAKKAGSGQTAYISLSSSDVTISGSNMLFSIAYTNIPKDGEYLAEAWLYSGTSTNLARVVAQGKINSHMSLYATDDSTFPWPTNNDTFALYVPYTDDVYSYSKTNLIGDTELVITGGDHCLTGSIASTITRDTELTTATGACATAWTAADTAATGALYTTAAAGWAASDVLATGALHTTISAEIDSDITTATGACATAWAAADTAATSALASTITSAYQAADLAATSAVASTLTAYTDSAVAPCITSGVGVGICTTTVGNRIMTNTVTEAQTLDAVAVLGATVSSVPTVTFPTVVVYRVQAQTSPPDAGNGAAIQLPSDDGSGDVYISPPEGNELRLLSSSWNQPDYTTKGSFYSTWGSFDWTAASNLVALGTISEGGTNLVDKYLSKSGGTATAGSTFAMSGSTVSGVGTFTATNGVFEGNLTVNNVNGGTNYFAGRVGIGTATPGTSFHVSTVDGGITLTRSGGTAPYDEAFLSAQGKSGGGFQLRSLTGSGDGARLTSLTAATEYWRINSTGLGIGTNTPAAKLHVAGSVQVDTNLLVGGTISGAGAIALTNGMLPLATANELYLPQSYTSTVCQLALTGTYYLATLDYYLLPFGANPEGDATVTDEANYRFLLNRVGAWKVGANYGWGLPAGHAGNMYYYFVYSAGGTTATTNQVGYFNNATAGQSAYASVGPIRVTVTNTAAWIQVVAYAHENSHFTGYSASTPWNNVFWCEYTGVSP